MPIEIKFTNRSQYLFTREERIHWYGELMATDDWAYRNIASTLLHNSYPQPNVQFLLVRAGILSSIWDPMPPDYAAAAQGRRGGSYLTEEDYRAAKAKLDSDSKSVSPSTPTFTAMFVPEIKWAGSVSSSDPSPEEAEDAEAWANQPRSMAYPSGSGESEFIALPQFLSQPSWLMGSVPGAESEPEPGDSPGAVLLCSPENPEGICPRRFHCAGGACAPDEEYEEEDSQMGTVLIAGGVAVGLGLMIFLASR